MDNNYCVIMAGGIGSRFWPMSTADRPKQFLDILGMGKSLIQMTFDRLKNVANSSNIFVVTNECYVDLVKEQLPELRDSQILREPSRKNTAACIAYAAYKVHQINPKANLVVAPSDHLILKEEEFSRCIKKALNISSKEDCLLALGIKPSRPDTGYGYIQSDELESEIDADFKKVKVFTEKPSLDIAESFLASGDYNWNSGIFIWSAKTIINSFQKYLPEMHNLFSQGKDKYHSNEERHFIKDIYQKCESISIDYGILEKSDNVYVYPCDFGWSDLGTWGSLYTHLPQDNESNAVVGNKVLMYDSNDCLVHVPKEKTVVLQGLKGYVVVESDNTLLVCKKEDEQKIKLFVEDVKKN